MSQNEIEFKKDAIIKIDEGVKEFISMLLNMLHYCKDNNDCGEQPVMFLKDFYNVFNATLLKQINGMFNFISFHVNLFEEKET